MSMIRGGRGGSLAVDGNRNPHSNLDGSCSVANANPKPWWAVDLGAIFNVKEVAILQSNSSSKHENWWSSFRERGREEGTEGDREVGKEGGFPQTTIVDYNSHHYLVYVNVISQVLSDRSRPKSHQI